MQRCTVCTHENPDTARFCDKCGSDLSQYSEQAVALATMLANPRVNRVRLVVAEQACPACHAIEGAYERGEVPALPAAGCSCAAGCTCYYEPYLNEIYP